MPDTSFSKDKMKVVLLEGVHASAVDAFRADGYSNIDLHQKALPEPQLIEAARDAYIVGIRSATQLTRGVLEASRHLTAIGCFASALTKWIWKPRKIAASRCLTRRSRTPAAWRTRASRNRAADARHPGRNAAAIAASGSKLPRFPRGAR